jgi:general secretion pathway protein E
MTLAAGQPSLPSTSPSAADLRAAAGGVLARRLSPKYLEQHCLIPVESPEGGPITILAGAALDPTVTDELSWTFGRRIKVVAAPAAEIQAAIMAAHADSGIDVQVDDLRGGEIQVLAPEEERIDDLRALATQAPVIKLVNVLMLEALKARASDIHLESMEEGLRVRYRIDGVLHDAARPPKQYQPAIVSRVKIMADLNIAERRLAQDGRIRLRLSDREVDLRVSTVPALHGEGVVLRILDRGGAVHDLDDLGMAGDLLGRFDRLLRQTHGIILVTGPTGSGKTTTLYAGLRRINEPGVKVVTVEDPVEYQVQGVTQIPVNPKVGLTFAAALRSILRHDPDVIMVGEMRDRETATIAIQSALTGHLVFSTLHTNDAPGGITRLVDMGVEPYLVAATVHGILAQRLVRVVCEECAEPYEPSSEELAAASPEELRIRRPTFRRGRGCDSCARTGYRGRTGIYELMVLTDAARELVVRGASLDDVRALARREGLVPLRMAGWAKACEGVTTLEEVLRVTRDDTL